MNAIDLALAAGGATTVGFGLLLIRRRRARTRLDRLSRHRRTTAARRQWPTTDRLTAVLVDRPGVAVTAGGAVAGGIGLLAGGPVAAVLAVAYVAVGLIGVRHRLMRRAADRAVAELLDAIEDAVGDLRAGVVPYATAAPYPGGADVALYAAPGPVRPPGESGLGATVRRIWEAADENGRRPANGDLVNGGGFDSGPVNGAAVNRGAVNRGVVSGAVVNGAAVNRGPVNGAASKGAAFDGSWVTDRGRAAGRSGVEEGAAGGGRVGSAGRALPVLGGRRRRREDAAVSVALARLEAAHRVSEALGTPLADLLDQVEADLRAGQALRLNLAAQTSGAQTTTTLLVGLPAGGLWLGAGIGVDPVGQLLHTPLGAACAITAVALQCAGLLWTGRMVRSVVSEVR
ncbi:hypothetical protein OHA72_06790 [Dactylosporangium sp. NBC_01737]|uniref:type II secretion system F family protein n=1 Tax=Dactylosporangium sp. NBC_01737 TaxID=2975959 RepID=UPI002E147850|nr:hypothetical protein OHA72_06790 [Dactylosporangium sp. NBC_01737]